MTAPPSSTLALVAAGEAAAVGGLRGVGIGVAGRRVAAVRRRPDRAVAPAWPRGEAAVKC
jgi:hypothetical protein